MRNSDNKKKWDDLMMACKKLQVDHEDREKQAEDLRIAIKELAFQNEEREKRAEELLIANRELAYQNEEKEKRVQELEASNLSLIMVENQLKVVNKELEAFSYSVSHDLRAPLRAISGYSNMLQEDYSSKLDAEANRILNVIVAKTHRMGMLIDDLLTFSKMARLEVTKESIDINKIVQDCIDEVWTLGANKIIDLKIKNLPPCSGDTSMLKQVWDNLIGNAIKYTSKNEKPSITIGATEDEKKVVYFIQDNGAGFDMKYSDKLFGVFQRLHREDEFEGTGIGLALVKRIINKHNGDIWANAMPDKGATFYFSIPKKIIN